jgi:hypothetical protein
MAQLDKELFIEYIYWIFLVLIHFYTSFFINKTVIQINARTFILKYFFSQIKNFNEQQKIVKFAIENFNKTV